MRHPITTVALFCLMAFFSSCSAKIPVQLYEIDSGRTVEIHPDDILEIVLDTNPTTGYQWKIVAWDTDIVEQSGEAVYKPKSDIIGSGGEMTFRFKALSSGQISLRFVYIRPFEENVPPINRFEVTIVVF